MLPKEEHEQRMELYRKGMTDRQIAEQCFLCTGAIRNWRNQMGLPSNHPRNKLTSAEEETMEQMYRAGASDGQIARETGRCLSTVQSWRRRNGLPGNYGKGGKPIHERRANQSAG